MDIKNLKPSDYTKIRDYMGCGLLDIKEALKHSETMDDLINHIATHSYAYKLQGHHTTCEGRPWMKGACTCYLGKDQKTMESEYKE